MKLDHHHTARGGVGLSRPFCLHLHQASFFYVTWSIHVIDAEHGKRVEISYASSEGPDQLVRLHCLIKTFIIHLQVNKLMNREDPDQAMQMCRLILIFIV